VTAEIILLVSQVWLQSLRQLQLVRFHEQMLSRNMADCCLGQIELLATSVSGFPWTPLKGLPHKLHNFISGMGATRTLSLADAPFGRKQLTSHVS
jgi:hypothetical protein